MNDQSKYLKLLPPLFRDEGVGVESAFLDRFLKAFERALSGIEGETDMPRGTEELLDRVDAYFDPNRTPSHFLPWLASWVAMELEESDDWNRDLGTVTPVPGSGDVGRIYDEGDKGEVCPNSEGVQNFPLDAPLETRNRNMIKNVARLYRMRGTREGLEEYIRIYADKSNIYIREFHERMRVKYVSTVGQNTIVGNRPYYFRVEVYLPEPAPLVAQEYERAIRSIVDKEKPAHTYYDLIIRVPAMRIGVFSTIGKNTLLGGESG